MKKVSLIIFDGLWLSDINPEEDAFKKAKTPYFDSLLSHNKHSSLEASDDANTCMGWKILFKIDIVGIKIKVLLDRNWFIYLKDAKSNEFNSNQFY